MTASVLLQHNKVTLALHELRGGSGRPLLHLHGLGERTPDAVPAHLEAWPGPVWGLDLTGHGESSVPVGGGYFCEALMADVDIADNRRVQGLGAQQKAKLLELLTDD